MARRGAVLMLVAGTALAVPAGRALAFDEVPPPSGFAPSLEAIGISDIQRLLQVRGYDAGPATGAMNAATYHAILAYQRDYGLAQDGIAGPLVQNALHFMAPRARAQLVALTPPTSMPPAPPLPPVILPPVPPPAPVFLPPAAAPVPQAAAPAPAAAPDASADAVPKASPSTPVETAPVTQDVAPATPPPQRDEAAVPPPPPSAPEAAAPAEAAQSPAPRPHPRQRAAAAGRACARAHGGGRRSSRGCSRACARAPEGRRSSRDCACRRSCRAGRSGGGLRLPRRSRLLPRIPPPIRSAPRCRRARLPRSLLSPPCPRLPRSQLSPPPCPRRRAGSER